MRGTLAALAVALVLSGAVAVPVDASEGGRAVTEEARAPVAAQTAGVDGERRVLSDDVILPARGWGSSDRIRKWPGKKIPYYESIPKKWDWSLQQAVDHWNASGGGIKFVKVPRRKAKLIISYGDTGGADGVGTLGYQYRNFVYLSPAYKKADQFDPETRVWVGRLFAHELGHVLGFDHTSGQCALMYPVYNFGVCETLTEDKPGYYNCRWIDKKLLRRFVQMYGGKPKRPPKACLIEELPGELQNARFSGGDTQGQPVRVSWQPPGRVRPGTKVYVTVWEGDSCSAAPTRWEIRDKVDPKAGSWTDPSYGLGTWCYQVHIENRYGAARAPTTAAVARYAPVPAAPAVGPPVYRPDDEVFAIAWNAPDTNTELRAMRNRDDPDSCPAVYDEYDADWLDRDQTGAWLLYPNARSECVSLFAVTSWGTVSPPTQVTLQIPAPAATPTVGVITPPTDEEPAASATVVLADSPSYRLGIEVLPGACPATPPPDAEWWDGFEDWETPGRWLFYPESSGTQCVLFAAVDWYDQTGPVQKRTFTAPP